MCACLWINEAIIMPCQRVQLRREGGRRLGCVWAGFAQREALGWWEKNGGLLIDVPAERFALRFREDSRLVWNEVPSGHVIRGIIDSREGAPLLKVVIRPANDEEQSRFEHPRMPLFAPPLFLFPATR
jgi:hypothetical protein